MKRKHPCSGCRYYFGAYEGVRCCNYIFVEGHRRPCPPGKDCTVSTKKGRRKRGALTANSAGTGAPLQKTCPHCGNVFVTTYSNKIYCGTKCYEAARNRRKWERRKMRK